MSMTRSWKLTILATVVAMALTSVFVMRASTAAFTATTDTQGNWDAGTVALSDDDGTGTVQFTNASSMVPADTDQACVTTTYDGDVNAEIKLYGSTTFTTTSDVGQYLDLTIEEVTVGAGTCASPDSVDSTVYTGTLSVNTGAFAVDHTAWADGATTSWTSAAPATNGASKVFRITVTLQDDNNAQGQDTAATFTWEAQNV